MSAKRDLIKLETAQLAALFTEFTGYYRQDELVSSLKPSQPYRLMTTNPTLILGGGFTGLFTALHLSHQNYSQPLTLIEPQARFSFKPLLYEFLSDEMSANQVWPRYEELLHGSDVRLMQDRVQAIDLQQQQVQLASGSRCNYSYLVLALGSVASYLGLEGVEENTFPFNTGADVADLKQHLQNCLQQASQSSDPQQRQTLLTVAIIGAGPTGVELAATLADLLPNWYAQLDSDPQEIRVVLLNRGPEILKGDINRHCRQTAQTTLKQRSVPVEVITDAEVSAVSPQRVEFEREGKPEAIPAATVVWTAGKATHPLVKTLPIAEEHRDKRGWLRVEPTLQLPDFPEVFAGGDCAVVDPDNPLPPTAQVAYQQGKAIAQNLQAASQGEVPQPAEVRLRGSLMKLGLGESVANLFDRFEVTGKVGHTIREATYLELLPAPVHNFKATTEWLIEEIFHQHHNPVHFAGAIAEEATQAG